MSIPPTFVRVRFARWPALWLPLFLLWPLLFVLLWPLFALGLIALLLIEPARRAAISASVAQLWRIVCALRGTEVDVEVAHTRVNFAVY